MSDRLQALMDANDKRVESLPPKRPEPRRPDRNNPYQPEYRRPPRDPDPTKWAPPPYRDREAERLARRLSKKEKP